MTAAALWELRMNAFSVWLPVTIATLRNGLVLIGMTFYTGSLVVLSFGC